MHNALATITLLALSIPALAQPSAPAAPPPQPRTMRPVAMKLTVKVGSDTRVHELVIFDDGCGHVEDKATSYEDDIQVCARAVGTGLQIEASWKTRTNNAEYRTKSATVMARKTKLEVGRTNGTRFTLELL